jgi:phosphopantetheinyl transferase
MEPYLFIEHHHTSQFEIEELLSFSDAWCQKIIDLNRKKESLLARLLLDKLCKKIGLHSIHECGLKKTELGKPFFSNAPDVHLSITHSDGFVWVAISNSPIGIDFEKINNEAKEDLKIAFDLADWNVVAHDVNLVFKYFSLKESYSKMTGTGFTMEPKKIQISLLDKNKCCYLMLKSALNSYVVTLTAAQFDPKMYLTEALSFDVDMGDFNLTFEGVKKSNNLTMNINKSTLPA